MEMQERLNELKQKTIEYHQAGMNGAQAVLQVLMDYEVIENNKELVEMTSAWKGGIAGDTCSAYAAGTLVLGLKENKEENLKNFNQWFKENFHSISCPTITDQVGGRPSMAQKSYCDNLSAETAAHIFRIMENI